MAQWFSSDNSLAAVQPSIGNRLSKKFNLNLDSELVRDLVIEVYPK